MKKIIIARSILHAVPESETIFNRGNIAAFPARTCEEALNLQGARRSDLVVADASMPIMGGVALCRAIREDEELRNVSIIVAADGSAEDGSRFLEAVANAVIRKPVDSGELFTKISELLVVPGRKDIRVLLRATISGKDKTDSFFGMSHNISISGMLLETDHVLSEGARFSAVVAVSRSEFKIECRVVRVEAAGKRFRYGVQFLNPDTKTLIVLDQFVKGGIRQ